jgi:predicted metal-dependent phosphoesterase TrpH
MKADLHMHTTDSDGVKTKEELFELAKVAKMDLISFTDHDVCKNVEVSLTLAKEYGIDFIPGIELSTVYDNSPVHVLGFFRDESYKNEEMMSYYKWIKDNREMRTHTMISNLKEFFDIEITYEEVKGYARSVIARPHIAKAIHHNYPEYSFDYIFEEFIGDHSKAYVPSTRLSVKEGIELLRRNNCVVILAHPTLLKSSIKEAVLSHDFDGLEAKYYRNQKDEEEVFRELVLRRGMIVSAGSDFHGIENDGKHGNLGEVFLDGEDLKLFMELYKVKK